MSRPYFLPLSCLQWSSSWTCAPRIGSCFIAGFNGFVLLTSIVAFDASAFPQVFSPNADYDRHTVHSHEQVARDTAIFVSQLGTDLTPKMVKGFVQDNVRFNDGIYGSCIAFEPDTYPGFGDDRASGRYNLSRGVEGAEGPIWRGMSSPWILPDTELWPGKSAKLYAPYAARGKDSAQRQRNAERLSQSYNSVGILFDLADQYNYFNLDMQWYHVARTQFLSGELPRGQGYWGDIYFDEGVGDIAMVTYSVPIWRHTPPTTSLWPHPDEADAQYGFGNSSVAGYDQEDRRFFQAQPYYFWGIATVDIDIGTVPIVCRDRSMVYDYSVGECFECHGIVTDAICHQCPPLYTPSQEYDQCVLATGWMFRLFLFFTFSVLFLQMIFYYIRLPMYICDMAPEDGPDCPVHRVHVTTCNRHQLLPRTAVNQVPVYVKRTGTLLDGKHFRAVVNASHKLDIFDEHGAPMARTAVGWSSEEREPSDLPKGELYVPFPKNYLLFGKNAPAVVWIMFCLIGIVISLVLQWSANDQDDHEVVFFPIAFGLSIIVAFAWAALSRISRRRAAKAHIREKNQLAEQKTLFKRLEQACWAGSLQEIEAISSSLRQMGLTAEQLADLQEGIWKRQSQHAGVSVAYIVSEEFSSLAKQRTGKEDPNFYDLKAAFFLGENPIGKEKVCPRDGRRGCALIDTLPREHRRECTHFLSWTWGYSLSHVQNSLRLWTKLNKLDPAGTFLYMCFFVNNQYRILVNKQSAGSDSLEEAFEGNLMRIKKMVALLDHWDRPIYLSRIWTIFEQYTAITLNIPVQMLLPRSSSESLIDEIRAGEEGFVRVTDALCRVDSKNAEAYQPEDEVKVKKLICEHIGFDGVDEKVREFVLAWIGQVVEDYMAGLVSRSLRGAELRQPAVQKSPSALSGRTQGSTMSLMPSNSLHSMECAICGPSAAHSPSTLISASKSRSADSFFMKLKKAKTVLYLSDDAEEEESIQKKIRL